jgi:hypothetical protein
VEEIRFHSVCDEPLFIYNAWKKSRRVQTSHFSGAGNKPPVKKKTFIMEQFVNAPYVVVEAITL